LKAVGGGTGGLGGRGVSTLAAIVVADAVGTGSGGGTTALDTTEASTGFGERGAGAANGTETCALTGCEPGGGGTTALTFVTGVGGLSRLVTDGGMLEGLT